MTRAWVRELLGWLVASAVALTTAATVASSARADLLFRDGDSLVVALLSRSVTSGDHLDWAMSSVLFLPETAVFTALDAVLPLDVGGLFAVNAVLNLLALYGAIRLVAGRARESAAPVTWSVIALGAFGILAMTETSGSRDALDPASLSLTTTYYSATVVAAVATVGIIRRMLDRPHLSRGLAIAVAAVAAASTLSNPLFAAWATVPVVIVLLVSLLRPAGRRPLTVWVAIALVAGTAIGFLGRIPFAAWIANTGAGYVQPALWRESLGYYAGLVGDRAAQPLGVLALLLTAGLVVAAVVLSVRSGDPGARFVAAMAWVAPLLVVIGAIALGTHAARYLQPIAFAPVLALVADPRVVGLSARLRRQLAAVGAAVLIVLGGLGIPRLTTAAETPDADLACVVDWVDASDRTGAGQFWTVRLPKLHLDDPTRLVQVDHRLDGYAWLVNRTDVAVGEVSFLVEDAQTVPWELPSAAVPDQVVDCGRYRILDFGERTLPLGPSHS